MTRHKRPEQAPITSPRSDRVRRIAALSGRSARRRTGLIRADGPQAVRSLLAESPDTVRELFLTERTSAAHPELAELGRAAGVSARLVPEHVVRALVRGDQEGAGDDVPSPQGAVAVAERPALGWEAAVHALPAAGPVTVVVLCEVRDPGNVGTIVRTADAAGADLVLLTEDSADPFAPKAVRSSAGSVFHLPVVPGAPVQPLFAALRARDVALAVTSGYAATDLFCLDLPPRLAWVLGNEARGVDAAALAAADHAVRIPLAGRAESLNVATAATVCLFETLRRRPDRP
ncbi:RNA methyltransferase [Brachybacterium huguangmaarense]|uniref:RNA methyltransferase n=1 Tax=Brachybacterium huguangmaarense TaxID=1652028 RepID=A0ABY6FXE4_9MICO|nr:RNA methyltransferase [Brachybacterium huguangmaarense]